MPMQGRAATLVRPVDPGAVRGGGGAFDFYVSTPYVPLLVLAMALPGLLVTGACAARVTWRIEAQRPHGGVPGLMVVGLALMHCLAPSLSVATVSAWAGWGSVGTISAGLLPQLGTTVLVVVLLHGRHDLDPWAWADPLSAHGRRSRARRGVSPDVDTAREDTRVSSRS